MSFLKSMKKPFKKFAYWQKISIIKCWFKSFRFFIRKFFKTKQKIETNNESLLLLEQTILWTEFFLAELQKSKKKLISCADLSDDEKKFTVEKENKEEKKEDKS